MLWEHILIYLCASFGGFLFGYDTSIVNGALFQLKKHFSFPGDSWQSGCIVSLGLAGAFVGSAASGVIADRMGRRAAILLADVMFIAGSIVLACAPALWVLFVGRVIIGMGVGAASVVVPVYLAEISPAKSRGRVVTFNGLFIVGGQAIAAVIGTICVYWTSHAVGWRIMFGLGVVPAALQVATLVVGLPETPRWLRMRQREADAVKVEQKFNLAIPDEEQTHEENGCGSRDYTGSGRNEESESRTDTSGAFSFSALLAKNMRGRLIVGGGLQCCQQFVGINTVMYYSAAILHDAGIKGDTAPVLWGIPFSIVFLFFTYVGFFSVDRFGRRFMGLISCMGLALTTLIIAAFSFAPMNSATRGAIFIVLLFVYLIAYAPGIGPIPWIVNAEIYPIRLRSAAAGVAAMVNWASNSVVSMCFPVLMGSVGSGVTFSILSLCCLLSFLFIFHRVPETNGKTLEEIEAHFEPVNTEDTQREDKPLNE